MGHVLVVPQLSFSFSAPVHDSDAPESPVPGTHALVRILVPAVFPQGTLQELQEPQQPQTFSVVLPARH